MHVKTEEIVAGNVVAVPRARVYQIDGTAKGGRQVAEAVFPAGGPWFCKEIKGCIVEDERQLATLDEVLAWMAGLGVTTITALADCDLPVGTPLRRN